jgi:hypothetical protein
VIISAIDADRVQLYFSELEAPAREALVHGIRGCCSQSAEYWPCSRPTFGISLPGFDVAVIDPVGLFSGDRLRRCSNAAQLHWPRLFLASDGYGRLEINYARIVGRAYPTFNPIPSEADLESFIQEYVNTFLLFPYEVGAQLWGQWDTRAELLPRYKTAADRRSPIPPEPAFSNWKQMYRTEQKAFPKSFGNISATFLHGVGEGVGVGKNICSTDVEEPTNSSR